MVFRNLSTLHASVAALTADENHCCGPASFSCCGFGDEFKQACGTIAFLANHIILHRAHCVSIYAFAKAKFPPHLESQHINVSSRGVTGRCDRLYDYGAYQTTGVRLEVQAYVCSQLSAIHAIADAVSMIETSDLQEFAFVCDHGTHRSVACACLLTCLVYPEAKIV